MKFLEITREEYQNFINHYENRNFLQDSKFSLMRKQHGWATLYVGIKEDNRLIASAMLFYKETHFKRFEYYASRGLVGDYYNEEVITFFTKELKVFLKKKKAYVLRMDPYFPLIEKDIDGNVVKDGYNHENVLAMLLKLGYKKAKECEQVHFMFALDTDVSSDDILKNMRGFTRRNILKGLKNGVSVRKVEENELSLLKDVLDSTSNRKHFANRTLEYFEQLYHLFSKDEALFLVAEINLADYIASLIKELDECNLSIAKVSKDSKRNLLLEKLNQIKEKIHQAQEIQKEKGDKVILSGGIFFTYGKEVTYLFGGNYKEYMYLCGPYVLQWYMINYAIEHKYHRYNFYGISGNFDPNDKDYGIYDFKKGFTGYVEELIGEFELPIDIWYYLFQLIHKIKK